MTITIPSSKGNFLCHIFQAIPLNGIKNLTGCLTYFTAANKKRATKNFTALITSEGLCNGLEFKNVFVLV